MKKVLVTGATGFVGRCSLAPLLAKGYEVHAASSRSGQSQAVEVNVQWHEADLLDSAQMIELLARVRPTHLLHFAWYAEHGKYWTSAENIRWVEASLRLAREFAARDGKRFVAAGTCAEYDWRYGYCSESVTPLAPATLYGTCKLAAQRVIESFAAQVGLSAAWGRIFFLYGPHEQTQRLVASVIRALLHDEVARCSHGNQIRDFLHVQDVADAFVALLDSDAPGAVNIGSGRAVTLKEIVERIGGKLGRADLIKLNAVPAQPNDPHLLVANVERLRHEIGWTPHYDIDKGLDNTIEWWQAFN